VQKEKLNHHTALAGWLLLTILLAVFPTGTSAQGDFIKTNCPRSQKQAYLWYFGEKAGIDFRSGNAVALTDQDVMTAYKASGVICDSLGNLRMFTNGAKVWDRTFELMPNATGLYGDLGVTQPCIIIPKYGDSAIYYIFTVDVMAYKPDNTFTTEGLTFTIIDLKLRNGLGDATNILNAPLLSPVTQKLTSVRHKNGKYFWLIAHKWDSSEFYVYLVSESGVHEPVISTDGSNHGGGFAGQTNAYGYMKSSPDGKKLALAISGTNQVELFDFNSETGVVSNARTHTMTVPGVNAYGIEFSPDSKKLYTSLLQIIGNGPPSRPSFIYQFDLSAGLINPVLIDSVPGIRLGGMQLGVDGRIYLARTINLLSKKDSLDVIYNPTRPGTECNYNRIGMMAGNRFSLLGRNAIYSVPNIVQSFVNIPVFTWDSCCHHDVTGFHITNRVNIDSASWTFGDGGSGFGTDPFHTYAQPGNYKVVLTEWFQGIAFSDSVTVAIHPLPKVQLGDTILLYKGASVNLHAGGGYMEYTWSNGSADSVITVDTEAEYRVEVKDFKCCTESDSVYVKVFEYFIPTAFTPNGDGLNDVFRVIGLYKNIEFTMMIYDRWGQLLFESNDINTGWDGIIGGKYLPVDTYVWIVRVNFLGQDITTNGDVVLKGTITLVR
jgi:gliding motility-associated-like protein